MRPNRPCVAAAVPKRAAHRRLAAIAIPMLLAGALSFPAIARAQALKPWVPPSADSLLRWSAEAKVRFKENGGDSVGGSNFEAYELVGSMGRKLVRSLGRNHLLQAHAVGAVLDSLGLDVDVALDPMLPQFILLVVRNPYRLTAHAVGFLYWYRGEDLRMQGAMFYGGLRPSMRAWWAGYPGQPYSLGVIDHDRSPQGRVRMTLFRLGATAGYWDMIQYPEETDDMSGAGEAAWVDVNGDERPELVAWVRAKNDTLFDACMSCPYIIHEITYTESERGMRLHDLRILPSPYATFSLFVRLLRDPAKVDEARLAGWGERRRAGAWMMEYAEEERWPRWLAFLHHGSRGDKRYIVHFELKEGRWIISDWVEPHFVNRAPGGAAPGDSARATPRPAAPGDSTRATPRPVGPGGRPGSRR
jgi:hypothetical protein